jgi:tRNA pseudouridine55 synthase
VYFHAFEIESASRFSITVGGGFYVRSLVRDVGRALGCLGHVRELFRGAIGPFTCPTTALEFSYFSGVQACPWWPRRELSDAEVGLLRRGERIPRGEVAAPLFEGPPAFSSHEAAHAQAANFLCGVHQGRVVSLLAGNAESLQQHSFFSPGL